VRWAGSLRIDDTRRDPWIPADRNMKITGSRGGGAQIKDSHPQAHARLAQLILAARAPG
jgi:hypothetical protein